MSATQMDEFDFYRNYGDPGEFLMFQDDELPSLDGIVNLSLLYHEIIESWQANDEQRTIGLLTELGNLFSKVRDEIPIKNLGEVEMQEVFEAIFEANREPLAKTAYLTAANMAAQNPTVCTAIYSPRLMEFYEERLRRKFDLNHSTCIRLLSNLSWTLTQDFNTSITFEELVALIEQSNSEEAVRGSLLLILSMVRSKDEAKRLLVLYNRILPSCYANEITIMRKSVLHLFGKGLVDRDDDILRSLIARLGDILQKWDYDLIDATLYTLSSFASIMKCPIPFYDGFLELVKRQRSTESAVACLSVLCQCDDAFARSIIICNCIPRMLAISDTLPYKYSMVLKRAACFAIGNVSTLFLDKLLASQENVTQILDSFYGLLNSRDSLNVTSVFRCLENVFTFFDQKESNFFEIVMDRLFADGGLDGFLLSENDEVAAAAAHFYDNFLAE